MNKETVNYVIIGAAATAVLYYLYTRSTPAAAAGTTTAQSAANFISNAGTSGYAAGTAAQSAVQGYWDSSVSTFDQGLGQAWDGVLGFFGYNNGYGGSGAGGTW